MPDTSYQSSGLLWQVVLLQVLIFLVRSGPLTLAIARLALCFDFFKFPFASSPLEHHRKCSMLFGKLFY